MMKTCTTCKKLKSLELFGKHKGFPDGYRSECKECRCQRTVKHWNTDRSKLKCLKCNEYKDVDAFANNLSNKHRDCRDRHCKTCKSIAAKNRRSTRERSDQFHRVFVERFQGMRDRAKKHEFEMEFTVNTLKELYKKQNGICALSGVSMTYTLGKGRTPTNVSVDRIDPTKGYTKDNVQLVCMAVNQMKSDLNMEELLAFCSAVIAHQSTKTN